VSNALSIIIPAYNESTRVGGSLEQVLRYAEEYPGGAEVIVVDDGSTDATADVVEGFRPGAAGCLHLLRHPHNRGKGAAVRTGFEAAGGEIVLFTDADLSAPMTEAPRLIEPVATGRCDVAIGSRALDLSRIRVNQTWVRRTMGRTFNRMVRVWTGLNIHDTQCGFKVFRRSAMTPIFARQQLSGFAFDVELLYLACRRGLRVLEIPVIWNHVEASRVSLIADSAAMFGELLRIRVNEWRGLYADAPVVPQQRPGGEPSAEEPP
jgi:dolichyl-phosphate beta-glucosyltransferase